MTIPGAVSGGPKLLLRLEGTAVLALSLYLYSRGQFSWLLFAALILVPDVSLVAYLAGPRAGAAAYNALHTYVGPIALATLVILNDWPSATALIWFAHIGMDRALGLGLKYPSAFADTHLGRVGRGPKS